MMVPIAAVGDGACSGDAAMSVVEMCLSRVLWACKQCRRGIGYASCINGYTTHKDERTGVYESDEGKPTS